MRENIRKFKAGEQAYVVFNDLFSTLPLAHVINDKVLVVHGRDLLTYLLCMFNPSVITPTTGLFSKEGVKLSDIKEISRFHSDLHEPNIPEKDRDLMYDLSWSDPDKRVHLININYNCNVTLHHYHTIARTACITQRSWDSFWPGCDTRVPARQQPLPVNPIA